jgi:toxin CcdB
MIRQFDVFANPFRGGRQDRPYVISIQHGSLDYLPTRLVVPLVIPEAFGVLPRLMPMLKVRGAELYLSPAEIVATPIRLLQHPIENLESKRAHIIAALDLVFTGI